DTSNLVKLYEGNRAAGKTVLSPKYYDILDRIFKKGQPLGHAFMMYVYEKDNLLAGGMFLQEGDTTYNLSPMRNASFQNAESMPFLIWKAIEKAASQTSRFDFLGSMLQGVEFFNRSFGAQPVPYIEVRNDKFPISWLKK
ncbi:MAG: hypothetical protein M3Q97_00630, partial [Bacteroidota bacterium]|nr:hypothetical protein [Bacteroidota bacterium]